MTNPYNEQKFFEHEIRYEKMLTHDIPFYVEEAIQAQGPILELACGSGRLLIPIAQKGIKVTGIDSSELMLEEFRRKLASETNKMANLVTLMHGDMLDAMDDVGEYRLVFVADNSIYHLLSERQFLCIKKIAKHLSKGGRFIIDVYQPGDLSVFRKVDNRLEIKEITQSENGTTVTLSTTSELDPIKQENHVQYFIEEIYSSGKSSKFTFSEIYRYVHYSELCLMIKAAGMKVVQNYGDHSRSLLTKYSKRMIIVAEK